MPTDTNLPTMVHLYLELIHKLHDLQDGIDTALPQHQAIDDEIHYYFTRIREEMDRIYREETPHGESSSTY